MTASTSTPVPFFEGIREIKSTLKELDSIPLIGATPSFPWEEFSTRLARVFEKKEIKIQPGEMVWLTKEELYHGIGDSPYPLTFSIPSLKGQFTWIVPEQQVSKISSMLLVKETHHLPPQDPSLSHSFYRFLAVEALFQFTQVSPDKTLSPILAKQSTLPTQDSLCWDIAFHLQNQSFKGRLIFSPEFRLSWIDHFAKKKEVSSQRRKMEQLVEVIVHLEIGKTQLTFAEWKKVKLGDFVILDSCSLDAENFNGRVALTLNGKQVLRSKIKDGTLKILEFPLLHEVETTMANESDNEEEDDLTDFNLSEDEDDSDFFSETDELFSEMTEEEEGEAKEAPTEEKKAAEKSSAEAVPQSSAPAEKNPAIIPEKIPVTLVVEVGQIQMTMDKLLNLSPGNLLEIGMHPNNEVDLTMNGKVVGKGELLRIGESIGVRILQLGH